MWKFWRNRGEEGVMEKELNFFGVGEHPKTFVEGKHQVHGVSSGRQDP